MVAGKSISKPQVLRSELGQVVQHLRQIQSFVVVSVAALRQQNCELDEDIATVLQRGVMDRMEDQIQRLESLLRSTPGGRLQRPQ